MIYTSLHRTFNFPICVGYQTLGLRAEKSNFPQVSSIYSDFASNFSSEDGEQSFMISWYIFLSEWTFLGKKYSVETNSDFVDHSEYLKTPSLTLVASKYLDY